MKTKIRVTAYALAFMLASFAATQTAGSQTALASRDWSTKNEKTLNALPKTVVWQFMSHLWKFDPNDSGNGKLCKFQFANLKNSRQLSLVVLYDGGGTGDCDLTEVFDKTEGGFEDYDFGAPYGFPDIQDINEDGKYELILETGFAPNLNCIATWPVIYTWNGTGHVDSSSEYKGYYKKQLTELDRQLNPLTPTPVSERSSMSETSTQGAPQYRGLAVSTPTAAPSEGETSGDTVCLKAELAKTRRFLGLSPDAGMAEAIKWADSNSPARRRFAVGILTDIGTPQAVEYLRTLSHDENHLVAWWARNGLTALANKGREMQNPTIVGQLIKWDVGRQAPQ